MKEELQSKMVEILGSIQTAAGKAGDFAMTQLPEIAQQYVTYGRAYTMAFAIVALLLIAASIYWLFLLRSKAKAADRRFALIYEKWEATKEQKIKEVGYFYESPPYRSQYFEFADVAPIAVPPILLGAFIFFVNLSQFLLVWFAPKVWLLKEIATLIR